MGKIYFIEKASEVINFTMEPGALNCDQSAEEFEALLAQFSELTPGNIAFIRSAVYRRSFSVPDAAWSLDDMSSDRRAVAECFALFFGVQNAIQTGELPKGFSLILSNSNTGFTLVVNFLNQLGISVEKVPSDCSDVLSSGVL